MELWVGKTKWNVFIVFEMSNSSRVVISGDCISLLKSLFSIVTKIFYSTPLKMRGLPETTQNAQLDDKTSTESITESCGTPWHHPTGYKLYYPKHTMCSIIYRDLNQLWLKKHCTHWKVKTKFLILNCVYLKLMNKHMVVQKVISDNSSFSSPRRKRSLIFYFSYKKSASLPTGNIDIPPTPPPKNLHAGARPIYYKVCVWLKLVGVHPPLEWSALWTVSVADQTSWLCCCWTRAEPGPLMVSFDCAHYNRHRLSL